MLRILPRSCPRHFCTPSTTRRLTSSALLSKWDSESISITELRAEAKQRGLSAKGSKKALASRIEEYEKTAPALLKPSGTRMASSLSSMPPSRPVITSKAENPLHAPASLTGKRELSSFSSQAHTTTNTTENPTEAPGNPEAPPVPATPYNFNIKIPDLSRPTPLPLADPPFVPDFWNSSSPSAPSIDDVALPKMVVVAGAVTHHGGGPSHNSMDTEEGTPAFKMDYSESFLDDIADDLGLPPIAEKLQKLYSRFK